MSWATKLKGILSKRRREFKKAHNKTGTETWYQQMNNRRANIKALNRKRRKLAKEQRQRTAR